MFPQSDMFDNQMLMFWAQVGCSHARKCRGRVVRYIDVCHSFRHSLNIVECDLLSTSKPPVSAKFFTLFDS